MCVPTESNSITSLTLDNLTKKQRQKLYLHDLSAHEGFWNLNTWIKKGIFPGVDPKLALEPYPVCPAYAFGKARHLHHHTHTGHISSKHKTPGQGVKPYGMESSTPGTAFTTKDSPSKLSHNYVSF